MSVQHLPILVIKRPSQDEGMMLFFYGAASWPSGCDPTSMPKDEARQDRE